MLETTKHPWSILQHCLGGGGGWLQIKKMFSFKILLFESVSFGKLFQYFCPWLLVKNLLVCALNYLYPSYIFKYVIPTSWCVNKDGWSPVGRVKFATMAATESCNQWKKNYHINMKSRSSYLMVLQTNNLFSRHKERFHVKKKIPVFFHQAVNTQANKNTSTKLVFSGTSMLYYKVGTLYVSKH